MIIKLFIRTLRLVWQYFLLLFVYCPIRWIIFLFSIPLEVLEFIYGELWKIEFCLVKHMNKNIKKKIRQTNDTGA